MSVLVVVWIIQKKDSLIIIHFLVIKLKGWRSLKEASINKEKLNYHGQGGGGDFGWVWRVVNKFEESDYSLITIILSFWIFLSEEYEEELICILNHRYSTETIQSCPSI